MKSIKNRIIIGAVLIILLPLAIGAVVIYQKITTDFKAVSKSQLAEKALDLASLIDVTARKELKFIGATAKNPLVVRAVTKQDYSTTNKILAALFASLGEGYESLFIANKDGIIISDAFPERAKVRMDIAHRPYFSAAKKGEEFMHIPIESMVTGKLLMVVSYPILDNDGHFLGIVGAPMKVEYLIDYISSLKIGETGYPILADATGRIILHPDEKYILTDYLRTMTSPTIAEKVKNRQAGALEYEQNGHKRIAGFATANFLNWGVVVSMELDEMMAPAQSIIYFLIFLCIIFVIAICIGISVFLTLISKPIDQSIKTLSEIAAHSTELFFTIDKNRKIISANRSAEKIIGTPAQKLIGITPHLESLDGTPEEEIWAVPENGSTWHGRLKLKNTKNKELTMDVLLVPLMDQTNKIFGFLKIARDITNELEVENRMQQMQKMESIGTLAGGIAHDFNNILSGIFGYSQLALKHLDSREQTKRNVERILEAAQRASGLVGQILTFSRQTAINFQPLQVETVINEAITLLKASIPSSIEILKLKQSDATILGDKTQLHQVMINLCTNAAHAIGNTSGTIEITLKDIYVEKNFAERHPGLSVGPHVQITISDSGNGIDPMIIDKIFDPFFTTKPLDKGTGLGLSVVHGIVRKMKGSITVYSRVGEGTSFNIIIPAINEERIREDSDNKQTPALTGTEKIMLIDDETAIIDTLTPELVDLGYSVESFTDPKQALETLSNSPDDYDVIITDNEMPKTTGIEFAIRALKLRPDIPVLLNSGYIDVKMETTARQIGIADLIKKPVMVEEIAAAIRTAVENNPPR